MTTTHSTPLTSKKALISKQPTNIKSPSPNNLQKRTAQEMEIDGTQM